VLEGYVHPRDRRFETKEAEDAGMQGRYHFHPEWAGYMSKCYKSATFDVTAVTMRDPKTKPIVFCAGRHTLVDHNMANTASDAARQRAERGDPVLHDGLGWLHHPGEEAQPDRRGLAAQFSGRRLVVLAGHAACHRGVGGRRSLFDGRRDVVPDHAGQSTHR